MINEFTGRNFECSTYIPSAIGIGAYENIDPINQVCSAVGAVAGQSFVNGDVYIESAYYYAASHRWRNFGILFAFMIFFTTIYLVATEYIQGEKSKGEVLVFRRGHVPPELEEENKAKPNDEESANEKVAGSVPPRKHKTHEEATAATDILERQTAIFQWQDVCYDIKIKKETRRILDHVDGWVKPGTLTALMGVSGAGKTTLLDVLATRVTMGVVTGEMLVDGRQRDESFQRKTGYVQQQDLHLPTSTVREALNFSALLRQPAKTPRKEKLEYVDKVIEMLDMQAYADAVVGVPGTGESPPSRASQAPSLTSLSQVSTSSSASASPLASSSPPSLPSCSSSTNPRPVSIRRLLGPSWTCSRSSPRAVRPSSVRFISPRQCCSSDSTVCSSSRKVARLSTLARSARTRTSSSPTSRRTAPRAARLTVTPQSGCWRSLVQPLAATLTSIGRPSGASRLSAATCAITSPTSRRRAFVRLPGSLMVLATSPSTKSLPRHS